MEATVTSLDPLMAKPKHFENAWTWDQVEPLVTKGQEEIKVHDYVDVIRGQHNGKNGTVEKWNWTFGEFEVRLNSGESVFIPREDLRKRAGIKSGSHVTITGGVRKGALATVLRYSEAWGEWEVKVANECIFIKRALIAPCDPPPTGATSGWRSWLGR